MAKKKLVPKKIGAVRVPKRLRKLGNKALSDPRAAELTAAALVALGGALVERGRLSGTPLGALFGQRDKDHGGKGGLSVSGMVEEIIDVLRGEGGKAAAKAEDAKDAAKEAKDSAAEAVH